MQDVVVVGGGWAGCSAAINAAKVGASVILLERTDMLLGTGLVGGIMRNNGRYTATEELIEMGANELFNVCDKNSRHKNIDFPGHKHASLYDISTVSPEIERVLNDYNVEIIKQCRVNKVNIEDKTVKSVISQDDKIIEGKVFIDTTGTAGPTKNCIKYGNGCAMCVIRCNTFGGRISLTNLCGVDEVIGERFDGGHGAMSGSCKLHKESLSPDIREKLEKEGVVVVAVPEELRKTNLDYKACQQYNMEAYSDNILLLDTGHAKMMTSYFNLDSLRKIKGFENARYEDPYSGGVGNSMRYFGISPRDNSLKVEGIDNLFCAGEKSGLLVGHTEAICTGALAGNNSVRYTTNNDFLIIPEELTVGDIISFSNEQIKTEEGLKRKYTFSGSIYFERMKEKNLYTTDREIIKERVQNAGLKDIFKMRLM